MKTSPLRLAFSNVRWPDLFAFQVSRFKSNSSCADLFPPVPALGLVLAMGVIGCTTTVGQTTNAVVPAPDLATNPPARGRVVNPKLASIFIAGDSTAARGIGPMQQGWAEPFADYFDPAKVNIVNCARGGRSS